MVLLYACEQFTTAERIESHGCTCTVDELTHAGYDLDDIIDAASDLVYLATGGAVTGRCETTVRPCATGCSCGRPGDACGCCRLDGIPLRGQAPIVSEVKIDGVALSETAYGVMDGTLVRVSIADRPPSWPRRQALWREDTEEGTFSITYEHGVLPFVAVMAATELACDLAAGSVGQASHLPPGTVGALMDGVSVTIEPDATVAEAARTIARAKHNRLPVVEHGRLIGVVTRIDVLDALTAE